MVICGIVSQIVHLTLLQSFPFFALTSPQFILAAGKTDLIGYGKHSLKIWIFELLVLIFYLIFSDGCHEPLFGVSILCWELSSFFRGKFVVYKLLKDYEKETIMHREFTIHINNKCIVLFQVMAYFTLCLWLVPFAFFVSLSANENILPTMAERKPLLSGNWNVLEFTATGQIVSCTIMLKN